jgi:hypothetical protein
MNDKTNQSNPDKGLIALFIKMSAEERLSANDQAVRTIKELRNAFQKNKPGNDRSKRSS